MCRIILQHLLQILQIAFAGELTGTVDKTKARIKIIRSVYQHSFIFFFSKLKFTAFKVLLSLIEQFFSVEISIIEIIAAERAAEYILITVEVQDTTAFFTCIAG